MPPFQNGIYQVFKQYLSHTFNFASLSAPCRQGDQRERGVLQHVVQGRLNKQIAADLGINERTVKLHRTAITTKLHVRSAAELARLVQEAGVFDERSPTFPKGL